MVGCRQRTILLLVITFGWSLVPSCAPLRPDRDSEDSIGSIQSNEANYVELSDVASAHSEIQAPDPEETRRAELQSCDSEISLLNHICVLRRLVRGLDAATGQFSPWPTPLQQCRIFGWSRCFVTLMQLIHETDSPTLDSARDEHENLCLDGSQFDCGIVCAIEFSRTCHGSLTECQQPAAEACRRACDLGDPTSCQLLATRCIGRSTPMRGRGPITSYCEDLRDDVLASCEAGYAPACAMTTTNVFFSVPRSEVELEALHSWLCAAGIATSCLDAARRSLRQSHSIPSPAYWELLLRTCALYPGVGGCGELCTRSVSAAEPQHSYEAEACARSCRTDEGGGCFYVQYLSLRRSSAADPAGAAAALDFFRRDCLERDSADACDVLEEAYRGGVGAALDVRAADEMRRRAERLRARSFGE